MIKYTEKAGGSIIRKEIIWERAFKETLNWQFLTLLLILEYEFNDRTI
jgi:hypothetical protein